MEPETQSRKRKKTVADEVAEGMKAEEKGAASFGEQVKTAMGWGTDVEVEKNATASLPPPASRLVNVPLDLLSESPTNPRKTFGGMDALAQSLKAVGMMVPLIVRKLAGSELHEIVAGHRRFRAAKEAGLESVPCDVRALNDVQVLEIQITENLQRVDLTELEEAEAYESMQGRFGYSVEQIAAKVGTSKATVYSRLKLTALCGEARKAMADGVLPGSVAVPLARLPTHALQAKALKEMTSRFADDNGQFQVISARPAIDWVQREFCHTLKSAPFSLKDEMLLPEAGSCDACPKNSKSATPGLFDDLRQAGQVCTDVGCFRQKASAAWAKKAAAEEKKGAKVLKLDEGAKLFPHGSQLPYGSKYVDMSEPNHADSKKRTWGELWERQPEDKRPQRVVAPDREMKAHDLVERDALVKALADGGLKWAQVEMSRSEDLKEEKTEAKELREAHDTRQKVVAAAALKIADSVARVGMDDVAWRMLARGLAGQWQRKEILDALGWESVEEKIERGQRQDLVRFLFVKAIVEGDDGDVSDGYSDPLKRFAKAHAVSLSDIEKAIENSEKAEALMGAKKFNPKSKKEQ